MPLYQEVWSFVANSGAKWNEVHYSIQSSLANASSFTPAFKLKRTNLMHQTCTWTTVRITSVLDPTIHTLVTINAQGTWGVAAPAAGRPANPAEAAVIRLASVTRAGARFLWMRGLPEDAIRFDQVTGRSSMDPFWAAELNDFLSTLASANYNYAIKKKKKGIANGILKTRILEVNGEAADGTSILTMKDNPLLVAGDMIEIVKAEPKLFPGLKGPFKVIAANGTAVTIQYSVPQNEKIKSNTGMGSKLAYWDDANINKDASGFAFGGSRKTKNGATGSRGARSAQKLRN